MKTFKSFSFRIYPKSNQTEQINKTMGLTNFAYNYCLEKKDMYKK